MSHIKEIEMTKPYDLAEEDFLVFGDIVLRSLPLLIHDRARGFVVGPEQRQIKKYFNKGFKIFLARLRSLQNIKGKLPPRQEKELLFMLSALVSAKRMLEEG
jgi:hypothetical protein